MECDTAQERPIAESCSPAARLGLVGGPALLVAGVGMLFGYIEMGSVPQMLATLPEFLWELSLGVWLLARGFNPKALSEL